MGSQINYGVTNLILRFSMGLQMYLWSSKLSMELLN